MAEEPTVEDSMIYEEEPQDDATAAAPKKVEKGSYATVHSSTFKDFLLRDELLKSIADCGFEHPSEVQHECIPQAILGSDIVCQAKSGMGKTAVFVLSLLHELNGGADKKDMTGPSAIVLAHTRELAYQIHKEFERFSKGFPNIRSAIIFGGMPIENDIEALKGRPHIVVGTPGRIAELIRLKHLDLSQIKHFVLDECDSLLIQLDMRAQVQNIFKATPHKKQVLMFSATLPTEVRAVCKKFMKNPLEIFVDDDTKLTLHGLQQHFVKLGEAEKNRRVTDIMDSLEFNQIIIFVKSVERCKALVKILKGQGFPAIAVHGGMKQEERIENYTAFKTFKSRILVSTDVFGRGMDIERVNIVVNYDMPADSDTYLHRVARAGRFGTKGLAIAFISQPEDADVMNKVQSRFEVSVTELPATIDKDTYMQK